MLNKKTFQNELKVKCKISIYNYLKVTNSISKIHPTFKIIQAHQIQYQVLIQSISIQETNVMGLPRVTWTIINLHQLKWQPIKTQNYQKLKIWWSYCYKEKFLVIKIQLVIHPFPYKVFATKKDTWQKTVLRQKHVLNTTLKDT